MEPTSLKIAEKHCGNIEIEIFVRGKESHGAVPEAGENAVDKCLRIIDQIGEITSLKPTILQIKGGDDDYSIPDFCRATIDIIVPPGKDVKYLLNKIKSINGIIVKEFCNGFEAGDSKTILSKALKNAGVKVEFTSMPSWTDAVNLYSADCDTVVWGPGELALCHTRNERVAVREIVAARKVLVELNRVIEKGI
jgi:acetylornithine deacetylase/succinyl-diaminopimelate desuccinylase-like protein